MHQKYTMGFSSSTNLVYIVASKIAGFSISLSSKFKKVVHNFEGCIVILYLLGNDAKVLRI